MTVINTTKISSTVTYNYLIVPTRTGKFTIPACRLRVKGTLYTTPPLSLEVTPRSTLPPSSSSPNIPPPRRTTPSLPPSFPFPPAYPGTDDSYLHQGYPPKRRHLTEPHDPLIFVEAELSTPRAYVNQGVKYILRFYTAVSLEGDPKYEPINSTGFLTRSLGQHTYTIRRKGLYYAVSEVTTLLFPTAPGDYTLGPSTVQCVIDPFSALNLLSDLDTLDLMRAGRTRRLKTRTLRLHVLPLPQEGRPSFYTNAVGDFTFNTYLQRSSLHVGEPFTLTCLLEGSGNLELISELKLPKLSGFKLERIDSKTDPPDLTGKTKGARIFTIYLYPTRSGSLSIPSIPFAYFDPSKKRYITLHSKPIPVYVYGKSNSTSPSPSSTPDTGSHTSPEPISSDGLRPLKRILGRSHHLILPETAVFKVAVLFPLLTLIVVYGRLLILRAGKEKQKDWTRYRAWATARKALRQAQEYSDIRRAIDQYLLHRKDLNIRGMNNRELSSKLVRCGLSQETASRLSELLEEIDSARFSPRPENYSLKELQAKTVHLLQQVEAELK